MAKSSLKALCIARAVRLHLAGAVLTTLAVIAAYAYLQRDTVEGLTAGSVKG